MSKCQSIRQKHLTICMSRRAFTPDGIVGILMSNNHSFYTGVKSVFPTCEHRPYRKGMYFGHSLFAQHRDELRHRPLAISKERSNRRRGDRQVRLAFQGNINDRNPATTTVGLSSAASAAAHYDGSGCGGSRAFALLSREVYN